MQVPLEQSREPQERLALIIRSLSTAFKLEQQVGAMDSRSHEQDLAFNLLDHSLGIRKQPLADTKPMFKLDNPRPAGHLSGGP